MFGSKLRSWMENHIVRPRKKGNKNKNAGSGNLASSSATAATASSSNGHNKGASASSSASHNHHHRHGSSSGGGGAFGTESFATISSPARRSEVSPIQCHTTSRAGWHSPQQETATSPQSDHYLYRHTVRSPNTNGGRATLAKSMPRKSSYSTTTTATLENNHYQHYHHPASTSVHYADNSSNDTLDLQPAAPAPQASPYLVRRSVGRSSVSAAEASAGGATSSVVVAVVGQTTASAMPQSRYSTTASSSSTSNEMLLLDTVVNTGTRFERIHQHPQQQQQQPKQQQLSHTAINADTNNTINSNTFTKALIPHPHYPTASISNGASARNSLLESSFSSSLSSSSHLMQTSTTSSAHSSATAAAAAAVDVPVKMRRKPANINEMMLHTTDAVVSSSSSHGAQKKTKTLEHRYGKILQRNENGELAFATPTDGMLSSPYTSPSAMRRRNSDQTTTSEQHQYDQSTSYRGHSGNYATAAMSNGNEINQPYAGQQQQHHHQPHQYQSKTSAPSAAVAAASPVICDNRQTAASSLYASNNNADVDTRSNSSSSSVASRTRSSRTTPSINAFSAAPATANHINNNNNAIASAPPSNGHGGSSGKQPPVAMTTFGNAISQQARLSPAPPPRRETLLQPQKHHNVQQQQLAQQQQRQHQQMVLQQQHQQHQQQQHEHARLAAESNRSGGGILRHANHRYVGGGAGGSTGNWMTATTSTGGAGVAQTLAVVGGGGGASHHQLAHMINSLSSPESAYSTGYSTDGTSPGATNTNNCTPEYYINMRTGTHYFPRTGITAAGDSTRVKFALNKIDEAISPAAVNGVERQQQHQQQQQLLYQQQHQQQQQHVNHHGQQQQQQQHQQVHLQSAGQRRLESMSCEMARRHFPTPVVRGLTTTTTTVGYAIKNHLTPSTAAAASGLSPDVQRRLTIQSFKGMESPSPRQRCRIRTNPWVSGIDPAVIDGVNKMKANYMETSSSASSGLKSSSETGADEKLGTNIISSGSEKSSSDTEIEVCKPSSTVSNITPGTVRKRRAILPKLAVAESLNAESDEDATFNELMGKFDESYCYEKETDILSDSDPTECISDLDTGQDGGDECDTDDLLEIDYIDTASIQEVADNVHINTGSCSYHPNGANAAAATPAATSGGMTRASHQSRRSVKKQTSEDLQSASRRRKRLTRTRKSSSRDNALENGDGPASGSPARRSNDRGTRSVGGTPVSLRRNKNRVTGKSRSTEPKTFRSRANSLSEDNAMKHNMMTVAESEKALIRADLEADVKYKQLIHEAEIILVSMKISTSASPSVRETPVPSPRRVCPIPTNKRVEMLRQCEADLRREINKTQKQNDAANDSEPPPPSAQHAQENINMLVNKRIEVLKLETLSTPNSPKSARFSPRKTHVSNFIHQNTSPTDLMRRKSTPDAPAGTAPASVNGVPTSRAILPQVQLNGQRQLSSAAPKMPKSPTLTRRRFRSQSPRVSAINSDSDSTPEEAGSSGGGGGHLMLRRPSDKRQSKEMHGNCNGKRRSPAAARRQTSKEASDAFNTNVQALSAVRNPLMSFRSVDMGNRSPETCYCPQSEPLKRKVYSGSHTLEKLKKTLEQESEIPKQALLEKISQLRRERKAAAAAAATATELNADVGGSSPYIPRRALLSTDGGGCGEHAPGTLNASQNGEILAAAMKQQMILSTLADLKRSLEDQSVELCGLNDDEI